MRCPGPLATRVSNRGARRRRRSWVAASSRRPRAWIARALPDGSTVPRAGLARGPHPSSRLSTCILSFGCVRTLSRMIRSIVKAVGISERRGASLLTSARRSPLRPSLHVNAGRRNGPIGLCCADSGRDGLLAARPARALSVATYLPVLATEGCPRRRRWRRQLGRKPMGFRLLGAAKAHELCRVARPREPEARLRPPRNDDALQRGVGDPPHHPRITESSRSGRSRDGPTRRSRT